MSTHSFVPGPQTVPKSGIRAAIGRSGAMALAFALFAGPLSAQTGSVTGTLVSGETGEPLPNVQVSLDGTGLGAISNNQGRFLILSVPAGEAELVAQPV